LPRQIGPGFLKSKIKDYHMWVTIDKETYMQKAKGLKVIESYTDPDGILEFSSGRPQIVTVWGILGEEENTPVVKCEQIKESRHDIEWQTEYSEYKS
jgi:hypothetical protein